MVPQISEFATQGHKIHKNHNHNDKIMYLLPLAPLVCLEGRTINGADGLLQTAKRADCCNTPAPQK